MSAFLRASNPQADLQAMALAALGASGIILPIWYDQDGWTFSGVSGSALTQTALSGAASSGVTNLYVSGFVAATTDGASGAYLCQHAGSLFRYASGGAITAYTLASGKAFVGAHYASGQSAPYALTSSGFLYVLSGVAMVAVSPSPAFGSPPYLLTGSGSVLLTLLASVSGVGTFTLSSLASGVSGFIAAPMQVPMCLAAASGGSFPFAVGGWSQAILPSGFSSLSLATDPNAQAIILGAASGIGTVSLWTQTSSSNFSFTQAITGLTAPSFVTWNGLGSQAFVCDPVSGHVYVLGYNLGTLSLSQTLSLSGATQAAILPDNLAALVTQQAQNQITFYQNAAAWTAGSTLALSGALGVMAVNQTNAVIGGISGAVSGAFYATRTGLIWSFSSEVSLGFVPAAFALDQIGNIYAVGSAGGSGFLAVVSGQSVAASGKWAGSANGVLWEQGQIIVADSTAGLIRMFQPQFAFANSALSLVQTNTYAQPSGTAAINALDFSSPSILAAGSNQTSIWLLDGPYSLSPAKSGLISVYNGSAFATTALGVNHVPEAMAFDPSGNISVVTLQNDLYTVSTSGGIISSGSVLQGANQPQTTPIGLAKLLWLNGHLYGATSLNDSLVQVS